MSASLTFDLTVIMSSCASFRMTGTICEATTVWPSLVRYGDDVAVDRREDLRVGEVGRLGVDPALRLRDLRVERDDPRFIGLALRVGGLHLLGRGRRASDQAMLASGVQQ